MTSPTRARYTYLFPGRDQGADVVAIATNITGGTAIVTATKLGLARGDYAALKSLAMRRAASGIRRRFRYGGSR